MSADGKSIQLLTDRLKLLEEKVAVLEGKGMTFQAPSGHPRYTTRTFRDDAFIERDYLLEGNKQHNAAGVVGGDRDYQPTG